MFDILHFDIYQFEEDFDNIDFKFRLRVEKKLEFHD